METLSALLNKQEALNPILRPYLTKGPFGEMLKHPLVQEIMYRPEMNAFINKRFEIVSKAVGEALSTKNWGAVIWHHERPWRIDILLKYHKQMTDREFWENVASVWIDSENIWQNFDEWRTLWENPRPEKKFAMDEEEQEAFAKFPDEVIVYRGVQNKGITKGKRGLSWTLDRDRALWFAKRFKPAKQQLLTGRVDKKHVHAYFMGRGEAEIVASNVKLVRRDEIPVDVSGST